MRARFPTYLAILLPTGMLGAGTGMLVCECPAAAKGLSNQESRNSQVTGAAREDPRGWFAKGQAALENGDLDAAEGAFRQVIATDPRAGAAYSNLGVIAMRRKQWDHAIVLLQKAEKLEPKMAGIRLNIGLVEYRRGNYGAAIAPLASVVREQPDSQQARYLLGLCQVFTKHYAEAVTVLEPLWPEKSNNVLYLYTIDIAARESGQKELDEKILHQMIAAGAETPEFHLIMGKAFLNRYEVPEATRELERAAALNPNLPFVHMNLGIAYMRSGDNEPSRPTQLWTLYVRTRNVPGGRIGSASPAAGASCWARAMSRRCDGRSGCPPPAATSTCGGSSANASVSIGPGPPWEPFS